MEQRCIFCAIANKQIPANIIYEDERVLAFLDINPLTEGHTLVIPKYHAENIFDISKEDLKHISVVAQKIANRMKEVIYAEGVDLVQASGQAADQQVPHFHLHIIPRKDGDQLGLHEWWVSKIKKLGPEKLNELAGMLKTERVEGAVRLEESTLVKKPRKPREKKRSKEDVFWIKRAMELT
jgi:histidine triad (HIT) family protein